MGSDCCKWSHVNLQLLEASSQNALRTTVEIITEEKKPTVNHKIPHSTSIQSGSCRLAIVPLQLIRFWDVIRLTLDYWLPM